MIRDNRRGKAVLAPNVISKQLSCHESIFLFGTWYKYSFFRESINDHQNIIISEEFWHLGKVYCYVLPGTLGCWQRQQFSSRGLICCLSLLTTLTVLYILLYLFLHALPSVVLSKCVISSLVPFMTSSREVVKLRDNQLAIIM